MGSYGKVMEERANLMRFVMQLVPSQMIRFFLPFLVLEGGSRNQPCDCAHLEVWGKQGREAEGQEEAVGGREGRQMEPGIRRVAGGEEAADLEKSHGEPQGWFP